MDSNAADLPHIAIVGAGIAGLTTALCLRQRGFPVSVYEASRQLQEVGAGLTLSPNANHVLNALGLEEAIAAEASIPATAGVRHYRTGKMLVTNSRNHSPRETYGADYLQIHRADLQSILADAARRATDSGIHLGHELTNIEQTDDTVTLNFANGEKATADLVIGCDGIRSKLRERLFGPEDPRFTGYIAWRGLAPLSRLPEGTVNPDSAICIAPGRTFTRYCVKRGTQLNYVAVAKQPEWTEEGWSVQADRAELLDKFGDYEDSVLNMIRETPAENCFKWALYDRDPLPCWHSGRIVLLGDAAHPMLPFLGQGAAMAIEDAMVIARILEDADSYSSAWQRFEEARQERTTMVLLESRKNIHRLQDRDPDTYDLTVHRNEEVLGLFDYNPVTVEL